jgi:hypothetical protein
MPEAVKMLNASAKCWPPMSASTVQKPIDYGQMPLAGGTTRRSIDSLNRKLGQTRDRLLFDTGRNLLLGDGDRAHGIEAVHGYFLQSLVDTDDLDSGVMVIRPFILGWKRQ